MANMKRRRSGSIRTTCLCSRAWTSRLSVLFLSWPGHLNPRSCTAQAECGVTRAVPLRVETDTGVGVLRAAANCTDSGGGGLLEADWAGAITIDSPITIAAGMLLSITGDDALAEVRGESQTRMFEVSPGGGLTLTNLKLSGGAATFGGAIYSDSADLTLDRCVFYSNVAAEGDGGAVWADGGNATIVGGEFLGNSASGYGGAVAVTGGARLVVREGSTFENNTALVGGALYCGGSSSNSSSGVAADSGFSVSSASTSCSLNHTEFWSNTATADNELTTFYDVSEEVHGGGAVAFLFVSSANVTASVFGSNYALYSGGALVGGNGSDVIVDGCTFENNTAVKTGGAIAASSMTLGGGTYLANNTAGSSGGAVLGWDSSGTIIFNDVVCTNNSAISNGGCFYGAGQGIVNDGTVMHGNAAHDGGCVYAYDGGELNIFGGNFSTCRSGRKGGFLYAGDESSVKITGGLIESNVAKRRAGAIYCGHAKGSTLTIEGGTFRNNVANEGGGVIAARGKSSLVEITGGTFTNNTAEVFGGFVFLHEGASLKCQEVTIRENSADNQGGAIYARCSTWVNSSCDLIGNESPQGAALYLTGAGSVTLENHTVTDSLDSSGSVLYMTESSVTATGVTFQSGVDPQEDSFNRAIQSDSTSELTLRECMFNGWLGDTVIYHRNSDAGSLLLDSCDFRGSSARMAVFSLNSDAKIRNAVYGDLTFANAGRRTDSLTLVNQALACSSDDALCGPGACVDSALGVLCECLDGIETCLDDGGTLSAGLKTPPERETYSPDTVSFELVVSAAENGKSYTIWDLAFEADGLELDVAPTSGILPPGSNVTVAVTGTPAGQDVGGNLVSRFYLTSVGADSAGVTSTDDATLEVASTFYLCSAFQYAAPLPDGSNGVSCKQCSSIEGWEGVDCEPPGATLASLPLRQGYWRSSRASVVIHDCFYSEVCSGGTEVSSADDYCAIGNKGPYCAVCSEGYVRGITHNTCRSCDDSLYGRLLSAAGVFSSVAIIMLILIAAAVFLVGGLDAVDSVRTSMMMTPRFTSKAGRRASKVWYTIWSVFRTTSVQERRYPERRTIRTECSRANGTIAPPPALDFNWEPQRCTSDRDDEGGIGGGESLWTNPWLDVTGRASTLSPGDAAAEPDLPGRHGTDAGLPVSRRSQTSSEAGEGVGGALLENRRAGPENNGGVRSKCCGLGETLKRWASRFPLDKFKILVVMWQILTVFSSIAGVEFPASYAAFLSWLSLVNLEIGQLFSASCVLPPVNFYARLLVTTLTPLVVAGGMVLTYQMAKRRAGIGSAGMMARRAAWSRHVAAGLLLTFLVFTSVSTLVFETFDCDKAVGDGNTYLRADYSLSCESNLHRWFEGYAIFMILVYPMGIPSLYAAILWKNRDLLNPRIRTIVTTSDPPNPGVEAEEEDTRRADSDSGKRDGVRCCSTFRSSSNDHRYPKDKLSLNELQELKERVRARKEHPELAPSMFLWKDFDPDCFYYEVIECARRMLLTGVLVFVAPHSWVQAATACILAFAILLGFELMRPHLDPTDALLYRLGCVVIFLSNFLALLIKMDAAGKDNRSKLGGLLVAVNVLLVFALLFTSWFTTQQSVNDSRGVILR